jgi:hypothetical protein
MIGGMKTQEPFDQYVDHQNAAHNLTQDQVEQLHGKLAANPAPGSSAPILAFAEFATPTGSGYAPAWYETEDGVVGTASLQKFTRAMASSNGSHAIERSGLPTAVLVSLDGGQSYSFLSDVGA